MAASTSSIKIPQADRTPSLAIAWNRLTVCTSGRLNQLASRVAIQSSLIGSTPDAPVNKRKSADVRAPELAAASQQERALASPAQVPEVAVAGMGTSALASVLALALAAATEMVRGA